MYLKTLFLFDLNSHLLNLSYVALNLIKFFFCNKCCVILYADYETAKGRFTIRTKTLEDSKMFPPQAHIFLKYKDPWLNLSENENCYETMYNPDKAWPEESLKRYKEYLGMIKGQ